MRVSDLFTRAARHRLPLVDGSALLLITAFVSFCCFEADIFARDEGTAAVRTVTLEEVMLVAAIFCAGLTVFALRRLREARLEANRRLAAEREARTLALHDALTGLPNRRSFDDALRVAIESPPRLGGSHILLLMDLNGFKRINDLFGHQAGDEVLVQVAGRLARVVRDGDFIGRLGGDEFVTLAMHTSGVESATGLATRVMDALAVPLRTGTGDHSVGVAIGVTLIPADGCTADTLLRKADVALYRAKEEKVRSASAVRFFEPAMDSQAEERDLLERELRQAVTSRSIRPFYQPLVALDGGGIVGFEALARWHSPQLGDVPPDRFIAVAEDAGIIRQLTMLLLEQACADAAGWPAEVTLAFNVSGVTLQDPLFGLEVLRVLTQSGFQPQRLEIELTESALVRDLEAARQALDVLRGVGVRIALDDFGTGYSSLAHLRALPFDRIKIDRSFVDGMEHDCGDAAIVKALIGLGAGLGAKITAEGVETPHQLALLEAQGCDQGQGYIFGKAVDAEAARRLLLGSDASKLAS